MNGYIYYIIMQTFQQQNVTEKNLTFASSSFLQRASLKNIICNWLLLLRIEILVCIVYYEIEMMWLVGVMWFIPWTEENELICKLKFENKLISMESMDG